jgi:hypothetical protein
VPFILTSPPYPGAQKYIRASSLAIGWLGLANGQSLRQLEELNIGREHYRLVEYKELKATGLPEADVVCERIHQTNPLRAHIASTYLCEMRDTVCELVRVLQPGGHLAIVAAANQICGHVFDTPAHLRSLLEREGLRTVLEVRDAIHSRGLMTRRNRTAAMIAQETVTVFSKP